MVWFGVFYVMFNGYGAAQGGNNGEYVLFFCFFLFSSEKNVVWDCVVVCTREANVLLSVCDMCFVVPFFFQLFWFLFLSSNLLDNVNGCVLHYFWVFYLWYLWKYGNGMCIYVIYWWYNDNNMITIMITIIITQILIQIQIWNLVLDCGFCEFWYNLVAFYVFFNDGAANREWIGLFLYYVSSVCFLIERVVQGWWFLILFVGNKKRWFMFVAQVILHG